MATDDIEAIPQARPRESTVAKGLDLLVRYVFVLIFFAVVGIASALSSDFMTFGNVSNLFQQASVVGIVAVGMTFVILTANIDLAVGSVVALSGVVVALLMSKGWDPVLAGVVTLLFATAPAP
jgi:ribose transport system permease protein